MAARPRNNSIGSLSFSVVGLVGILAVIMAGAVAETVDQGEVSPIVRTLATTIYEALRGLLKYL
jgi:hypothetical protein